MNIFDSVYFKRPQSNRFNLSHDHKLTCNMGQLIPFLTVEVVPGDRFQIRNESLTRFAPMLAPVMHRFNLYTHYFFVPNRILWKNWENWITGHKAETINPPTIHVGGDFINVIGDNSLGDYLGLVTEREYKQLDGNDISALPFAAYQKIWFDYYRDQNLIEEDVDPEVYQLPNGVFNIDSTLGQRLTALRKRAWRKDYFTSALPWAQKGEAVTIPFGEFQDVPITFNQAPAYAMRVVDGAPSTGNTGVNINSSAGLAQANNGTPIYFDLDATADTSALALPAPTIDELNKAYRVQEWLQKNARSGTRYIESNEAHFGVRSSDKRLQRPEFIGGSKAPIVVSEVLQTSGTNTVEENVLGDMGGHAISADAGKNQYYNAEEHGFIIGILSILPEASYFQGIPKMFLRKDKFDYLWPSFARLGEQPILNKELFYVGTTAEKEEDNGVFGYTPRYADYRYMPSRVSGEFRKSLDYWHYGRKFLNRPALNQDFVEYSNDNRIFAIINEDVQQVYVHMNNICYVDRMLPLFASPSL